MGFQDLGIVDSCMVSALRPSKTHWFFMIFGSPDVPGASWELPGTLWGSLGTSWEPLGATWEPFESLRELPQLGICTTKPSKTNKFNPNSFLCPLWFATV